MKFDAKKYYLDGIRDYPSGYTIEQRNISLIEQAYCIGRLDGEAGKAIEALRACVEAMRMQMGREDGSFHITQKTAKFIWDQVLEAADKLLEE